MSRWIVRTETSNARASAVALSAPHLQQDQDR
jgi:hypothetical protein